MQRDSKMIDSSNQITTNIWHFLLKSVTVMRGLKVAALVGTILLVINQGDVLISGEIPALWKIILTYFVPYCVSSYSTAQLLVSIAKQDQ